MRATCTDHHERSFIPYFSPRLSPRLMADPEPSTLPKNWWTLSDCEHPRTRILTFAHLSSIPSHTRCVACKCCFSVGWLTVSLSSPVPIHQVAWKVTANYNTNNLPSTPDCFVLCVIPFASCKIKCEICLKIFLETILIVFFLFVFPDMSASLSTSKR